MRLVDWPSGLKPRRYVPLGGPPVLAPEETVTGRVQTVADPHGLISIRLDFAPMRGRAARRFRGMVTGLHGGANAVRVPLHDPDALSWVEAGGSGKPAIVGWSNGLGWSNGAGWRVRPPLAEFAAAAEEGDDEVLIDTTRWGGGLDVGSHLARPWQCYWVTGIDYDGPVARCSIWPLLRLDTPTGAAVGLQPMLAMRLTGSAAGAFTREATHLDGGTLSLVEVPAYDLAEVAA